MIPPAQIVAVGLAFVLAGWAYDTAAAQDDTVKIGLVIPLTGASAAVGREISDATKLFVAQHGDSVAGKKIALIVRDDAGVPDNAKRLAADLIANDKVSILAVGLTPSALAMAPAATAAKIVTLVTAPGLPDVLAASPYYVSTAVAAGREASVIAQWAIKTGARKAVAIVSDVALAAASSEAFAASFTKGGTESGGQILDTLKVTNADFAPAVQRARELEPDAVFVDVPPAQTVTLARQFGGLGQAGIKLIGPGDIVDDDDLASTGDALLGLVSAGVYSATHPSQLNKDYVAAYQKAAGHRANVTSVAAYDAMALVYAALQKTGGNADGEALIAAIKGLQWKSPRGPVAVDPATRELTQTVYIRKIVKVDGEPWAIEIKPFAAEPRGEAAAK